mmetsp:Transcript_30465/g.90418  ORF Transcript_30465/g.90418 Transcript_30465/m.90418 type:complete len:407 (+) Transcript_30465:509-1729(+)
MQGWYNEEDQLVDSRRERHTQDDHEPPEGRWPLHGELPELRSPHRELHGPEAEPLPSHEHCAHGEGLPQPVRQNGEMPVQDEEQHGLNYCEGQACHGAQVRASPVGLRAEDRPPSREGKPHVQIQRRQPGHLGDRAPLVALRLLVTVGDGCHHVVADDGRDGHRRPGAEAVHHRLIHRVDVLRHVVGRPEAYLRGEAQAQRVVGVGVGHAEHAVEGVLVAPDQLQALDQQAGVGEVPVDVQRPVVHEPASVGLRPRASLDVRQVGQAQDRVGVHNGHHDLERVQPLLDHQLAVDLPGGPVLVGRLPGRLVVREDVLRELEAAPVAHLSLQLPEGLAPRWVARLGRQHSDGPPVQALLRGDGLEGAGEHLERLLVRADDHHVRERVVRRQLRGRLRSTKAAPVVDVV